MGQAAARQADDPILEVSDLAYAHRGVAAVVGCGLAVPEASVTALIGANGAGKSTTVKMIAGALRADRGRILFDGDDITAEPAWRRVLRGITLVPEGRLVFQHMTVLENLQVGGDAKRGRRQQATMVERVFDLFPRLAERRAQNAGSLSGGEQQMLAIGRGLMNQPRLMILDEPSLGLSPKLVGEIFRLIRRLNGDGISILLVEQNVRQSLRIADYAYVLEKGCVVRQGAGDRLLNDPAVKAAYLGLA